MTASSVDLVKSLRERTGAGMMDCKAALQSSEGDIEKAVDFLRKKGIAQAAKRAGREAKEGCVALRISGNKAALVEVNCETDFVARTDDFKGLTALALEEVFSLGQNAGSSEKLHQRIAVLSGKIGEKILIRRTRFIDSKDGGLFGYLHSNQKLGVVIELKCSSSKSGAELDELGKHLAMQVAASNPVCMSREETPQELLEREKAIFREETKGKPENIVEKIIQGKLEKFYQSHCLLEQPFIRDDKQSVRQLIDAVSKKIEETIEVRQFVRFQLGEIIPAS